MRRLVPILAMWGGAVCAATAPGAMQSPPVLERVVVADHPPYEGLIESEDDAWLYMIQIQRRPGLPMHLVVRPIDQHLVLEVHRLDAAEREKLRREIEQFRNRATIEGGRMEAVALDHLDAEGNHYRHYRGKWFTLDSTADEPMTRRVIVRTEQIFAAYRQILPPRTAPPRPPRLVVFGTVGQYEAFLGRLDLRIQNRACFVEEQNLVATGSDLARLAALMARINAQNDQLRKELRELEGRLSERLRQLADALRQQGLSAREIGRLLTLERRKFDDQNKKLHEDLARSDREIARVFHQNTHQTFARLYHESFHAYLENYVYPHRRYDVPRWLNEGLAMMFEGGILEGDTLRVDAPNVAALKKVKGDLRGPHPLPLEKLLAAGQDAFLPVGDAAQSAADPYYAHAWALAYYLTFEKQLLNGPGLGRYVRRGGPDSTPAERFKDLVNMPLEQFEKQWEAFVLSLRNRP